MDAPKWLPVWLKLDTAADLFSGLMSMLHIVGMAIKTGEKDGKPTYELNVEAIKRFIKIPAKWLGQFDDEIVWQKLKAILTPQEVELLRGWLKHLLTLRQNDDLIYFWGKAQEKMTVEETANALRQYLSMANTTPRDQLYKAMTDAAIADHILEAKPFMAWLEEVWNDDILPKLEAAKEKILAVRDKSHAKLRADNDRLEAKLAALRKKRTGSI